jgi:DNA-directed RNA polymerase specialized sigma24 family protein
MTAVTIVPIAKGMTERATSQEQEQMEQFLNWFPRCRAMLQFTACLILKDSRRAERAVRNCWIRTSRNPPHFESEGPFRSWIMRQLINEALSIHHESPGFAGHTTTPRKEEHKDDTRP